MVKFKDWCRFRGVAESKEFDISCSTDTVISEIKYSATIPDETELEIETNLSFDDGDSWEGWKKITNNQEIPDINSSDSLEEALLKFKVTAISYNEDVVPELHDIIVEINPVIEFENTGDLPCYPEMWIEKTVEDGGITITNDTINQDFIFSSGENAKGDFYINDIVYNGETITIGEDTFEINTGFEDVESGNIKVDLSDYSESASGNIYFSGTISDGETVTIDDDIYEFDLDDHVSPDNIKVDLSDKITYAENILTLNENFNKDEKITIDDTAYIFKEGSEDLDTEDRILIGSTKEETLNNIIYTINDISEYEGIKYGDGTKEHDLVEAEKKSDTKIKIIAKEAGTKGNDITTEVDSTADIYFDDDNTKGGEDCNPSEIIEGLKNKIEDRYNDVDYMVDDDQDNEDTLYIKAKVPGSKGNDIKTLSDCNNGEWDNDTLKGGKDASIDEIGEELADTIDSIDNLEAEYDSDDQKIKVTYKEKGSKGNVNVDDTIFNGYWDSYTLTGGDDSLLKDETIYIDNENEYIETDLEDTYRYNEFNDNFLKLVRGKNILKISGKCKIKFRYYFRTIQG